MKRMKIVSDSTYRSIVKSYHFKLAGKGLKKLNPSGVKITRYVLTDENIVFGIASTADSPERTSTLVFDLEILPEYQKQGLGTGILETFKSITKKPISLQIDHAWLIPFYKKAGFTVNWIAKDNAYFGYWIP
jgi:GNAT superfamily N-acetyltransferase